MKKSVTVTARITPALNKKLAAYAKAARRSKSWLIEDLIDRYIDGEIATVEKINIGLQQIENGKGVPHEDAMRRAYGSIAKKKRERRRAA